MSTSRRDFIKQAAMLSGIGATGLFPESIRRATAIEPQPGTTFLDAEHIVVLMQENRSFDHTYGMLRGVRGFDDPRAITLPSGNPVWAQSDKKGRTFLPFRFDIKETKATWMGSLPHSWNNQVDARNDGRYDRWLEAKQHEDDKVYAEMPLTLGYYQREDIPFYYALADAFTVCDQNFCSSLTGTNPNRLHIWTGTVRAKQSPDSFPHVLNEDIDYGRWASWPTFPERLEDLGVSWRIYQNELSIESGFKGEEDAWLASFADNPIEWFAQYGVRFAATHREYILRRLGEIPGEISANQAKAASATREERDRLKNEIAGLEKALARYQSERDEFSRERFEALPDRAKRLHERAFTINSGDPDFRKLTELTYRDGNVERHMMVPKGDPLHQFRKDVAEGKLPAVSWLVPSEKFSDHPCSAWYGAWYLSETFDILTKNPAVWKKTIFILTYDENDGYFDHVPPFVAPDPARPETGRVSQAIDAGMEYVSIEKDREWHPRESRGSSIGLGYRVPMVIASPWSRGGAVCSQVFDHTSVLQLMEKVLSHKTGRKVEEPNINRWRRTVCGDLTSAFRSAEDSHASLTPLDRDRFVSEIHRAQFKGLPTGVHALSESEIRELRRNPVGSPLLPKQESGVRPSCPLPYELFVSGSLNSARNEIVIRFQAKNDLFKDKAAGAPFTAYAFTTGGGYVCRNYAVEAGDVIEDSWKLSDFANGEYDVHVYGPNGYFWKLSGSALDPMLEAQLAPALRGTEPPDVEVLLRSTSAGTGITVSVLDNAYSNAEQTEQVAAGAKGSVRVSTAKSHSWYDLSLRVTGAAKFERRFAGRVETGAWGFSDPRIGSA
jgi:phospholipase C